jgi:hypothetical protein
MYFNIITFIIYVHDIDNSIIFNVNKHKYKCIKNFNLESCVQNYL